MPKFLSNIDLNLNELKNVKIDVVGTDPTDSSELVDGRIIYNSSAKALKVYRTGANAGWLSLGSGGGGSGNFDNFVISDGTNTQTVDDGETVLFEAGEGIDVTVGNTNKVTIASENATDSNKGVASFSTDNFSVSSGAVTIKDGGVVANELASSAVTSVKINNSAVTTAKINDDAVTYDKLQNVAANSILGNNTGSAANAIELTASQVRALISVAENANNYTHPNHSGQVTSSGDGATSLATSAVTAQTDLGDNFASADSLIVYDDSATALKEGTVGNLQSYMQSNLTFTTNTDANVSNANLLTALSSLESSGGTADQNINIGADSGDTIVITGNLQVSGTTTTVDSTTVNIGDHNIVLDSGNPTGSVVNGAGITLEGGSGDDATFTYSTTGPQFELKLGDSYEDLQVAKLKASSIALNGTNISATAAEINILDGGTSATSTTVASGDRLVLNDGGVMKQINVDDLDTYFSGTSNTLTNKSIAASQLTGTIDNARLDQQLQDVAGLTPTNGNFIVGNDSNFVTESGSTARASMGVSYSSIAQAKAGTSTATVLTPDRLSERMVVSTVDVSNSTFTGQSGTYYAAVNHDLGTEDIIVQLFDVTTKATVYADIERKNFAGTNSTNDIRIGFATVPDNDVDVVVTSVAGAQSKTASYS